MCIRDRLTADRERNGLGAGVGVPIVKEHTAVSYTHLDVYKRQGIICDAVGEIVDLALDSFQRVNLTAAGSVEPLEEIIDEMEETLKDKHIERLRKGKCTVDAAFPFVEALSNLERIADHCSNVGVSVLTYDGAHGAIDRHEYVQKTRKEHAEQFQDKYIVYSTKYFNKIKK